MKLSRKSEYALLALIELARNYDSDAVISAENIAKHYDIPKKFLEAILSRLRDGGLVRVYRGARDGYRLAKDPANTQVAEAIRLIDGAVAPLESVSVYFYHSSPLEKEQKTIQMFKKIRDYTSNILEGTSLRDLM